MDLINQIKERFEMTPADLNGIRELLTIRKLTAEELAELAVDFTDNCFLEYRDALDPKCESVSLRNMHSNYIVEAITLLLEFGLDPNTIINNNNVMWNTTSIDAPNVGPSVLKLLLENGGNPNHFIPNAHETLFESIDFDVSYEAYTHKYFHIVQCWLILMAYGACWQDNGKIPLTMLGDNTVEIFKNYQLYDYEIEPLPQEPGKFGCWIMHIYNIETKEEVAVFK